MKNTYQELELNDGTKVKLTLNFARLLRIKNRDPKFYDDLMRILQYKDFDVIFDTIRVLYILFCDILITYCNSGKLQS